CLHGFIFSSIKTGGSGLARSSVARSDIPNSISMSQSASIDSDNSDSSGLWSPISSPNSPDYSFSAFGSSNSFNLTGEVFSKFSLPRSTYTHDPQKKWTDFETTTSFWDHPATDSVPTWPTSTGSPTHVTSVSMWWGGVFLVISLSGGQILNQF
ncbi:unnamed protein product, partial [Staurois parvus]